jgi:hypothetical protein
MRNRSQLPWRASRSGSRPRIELAIVLAWAAIVLVTADRVAIWTLGFIAPAWSDTLAGLDQDRRIALVGGPAAATVLAAFVRRLFATR